MTYRGSRLAFRFGMALVGAAGCMHPGADVPYVQTPNEVVIEKLRLARALKLVRHICSDGQLDAWIKRAEPSGQIDWPIGPGTPDAERRLFDQALADLNVLGARPRYRHAANSAALVRDPRVWFDRVRPGLLLYGMVPPPLTSTIALAPVMTLASRVTAVKGMRAGEVTGYGARFAATRPTTIAIVPAGYADGLDLRLAGRGAVLIRGRRAPIVGSVCMDMLMVDVTGLDASPGDEVVIIGRQGGDTIDAREMADTIGSIPWEIVCRVGSRIERVYA